MATPEPALGVPASDFVPAELRRYRAIAEEMASLNAQQVVTRLDAASLRVRQLTEQLAAEQQRIQCAAAAAAKEEQQVDHYRNHYGCCAFFLGAKNQEAKVQAHEAQLAKCQAQQAEAAARAGEEQKALAQAQQEQATLSGQVARLRALEAEAQALLNAMFARPPWTADPALASLLSQQSSLQSQAASAGQTAGTYRSAMHELRSALAMCQQAVQLLQAAGWLGQFDMGMDFGMAMFDPMYGFERRDFFGEMIQMMEIQQAQDLVQAAAQRITQARSILPMLPFIDRAIVDSCMSGIFMDLLVGNFLSEMIIVQSVHQSMYRVGAMMQQTQRCVDWCGANESSFGQQAAALGAQAAGKGAEAEAFKRRQVDVALAAGAA